MMLALKETAKMNSLLLRVFPPVFCVDFHGFVPPQDTKPAANVVMLCAAAERPPK